MIRHHDTSTSMSLFLKETGVFYDHVSRTPCKLWVTKKNCMDSLPSLVIHTSDCMTCTLHARCDWFTARPVHSMPDVTGSLHDL